MVRHVRRGPLPTPMAETQSALQHSCPQPSREPTALSYRKPSPESTGPCWGSPAEIHGSDAGDGVQGLIPKHTEAACLDQVLPTWRTTF